jgi:hypothetical protein
MSNPKTAKKLVQLIPSTDYTPPPGSTLAEGAGGKLTDQTGEVEAAMRQAQEKMDGMTEKLETDTAEKEELRPQEGQVQDSDQDDGEEPETKPPQNPQDAIDELTQALRSAAEQLEEQRRTNQKLRDQKKGETLDIPQELWNVRNKLKNAEMQQKDAEDALNKAVEELKQFKGKPELKEKVVVLFPAMKTTYPVMAGILFALGKQFGDKIGLEVRMGDSMIYHSRNILADKFVNNHPEAEWAIWIDDDMIPPIGNGKFIREQTGLTPEVYPDRLLNVHFLNRLMQHKKTLIGGTYFGRRTVSPAMFKEGLSSGEHYDMAKRAHDGVMPVTWVATGCLLTHKSVFEDIRKKFPNLAPNKDRKYWDYFRPDDAGGEDVMFCQRAKEAGHQPFVDTGCQALHVGFCAYGLHNTNLGNGAPQGQGPFTGPGLETLPVFEQVDGPPKVSGPPPSTEAFEKFTGSLRKG